MPTPFFIQMALIDTNPAWLLGFAWIVAVAVAITAVLTWKANRYNTEAVNLSEGRFAQNTSDPTRTLDRDSFKEIPKI